MLALALLGFLPLGQAQVSGSASTRIPTPTSSLPTPSPTYVEDTTDADEAAFKRAIAGIVVGAIATVAFLILCCWIPGWYHRRSQRRRAAVRRPARPVDIRAAGISSPLEVPGLFRSITTRPAVPDDDDDVSSVLSMTTTERSAAAAMEADEDEEEALPAYAPAKPASPPPLPPSELDPVAELERDAALAFAAPPDYAPSTGHR
jgi:hypothetical protein